MKHYSNLCFTIYFNVTDATNYYYSFLSNIPSLRVFKPITDLITQVKVRQKNGKVDEYCGTGVREGNILGKLIETENRRTFTKDHEGGRGV